MYNIINNTALYAIAGARVTTPRNSRCHDIPADVYEVNNNLQVVGGR